MSQVENNFTEKYENDDDAIFDGVYAKHLLLLLTSGEYLATLRDHNASFVKAYFDTFDLNQEITAPMN